MAPVLSEVVIVCGSLLVIVTCGSTISKYDAENVTRSSFLVPISRASLPQTLTNLIPTGEAPTHTTEVKSPSEKKIETNTIGTSLTTSDINAEREKVSVTQNDYMETKNEGNQKKEAKINETESITRSTWKNKKIGRNRKDSPPEDLPLALPQKDDTVKGYIRPDGTYIVEDSAGTPCVMAYFKATLTIYYPTDREKEKYTRVSVSPPDDVDVSGKCNRDTLNAVLSLSWDQGTFNIQFSFDDLTDSWFVQQFSFVFNSSMSAYSGADKVETVLLNSLENKRFWQTSHARSFRCLLLHDVSLMDRDENYSGTIHFDEARVQALTKTTTFKTPKHCVHRVHRDEMVPVTVGSTLVCLTALTVVGYGIFRYFKVKKFQYGTME